MTKIQCNKTTPPPLPYAPRYDSNAIIPVPHTLENAKKIFIPQKERPY